jgi:hypothetical protein
MLSSVIAPNSMSSLRRIRKSGIADPFPMARLAQ